MNRNINTNSNREDKPLTRADIERFLHEVGSSDKLILIHQNLKGIDLDQFDLHGADLSGADLSGAHLSGAHLSGTHLSGADLSRAHLSEAHLSGAHLSGADLSGAHLSGAELNEADLSGAHLSGTHLSGAHLNGAHLNGADLSGADLSGAYLIRADLSKAYLIRADLNGAYLNGAYLNGADLSRADLSRADLSGARLNEANLSGAHLNGAIGLDELKVAQIENASTFRIRVIEEPLTPHNLTSIISAITHLSTKCWLIANKRFADLIEYTQTNDVRFVEETQLIIAKMSYNSPLDASFKIDLSTSNVAEAITTAIDGVVHIPKRLEKAALENKEKAINYAFEIALKSVTVLHPNTDEQTKTMLIQTLLPTILQLQNGKGLELVLPAPHSSEEKKEG